jgi:hypothetical protein
MKRLIDTFSDTDYLLTDQGIDAAVTYLLAQAKKLNHEPLDFIKLYCEYKNVKFIDGSEAVAK